MGGTYKKKLRAEKAKVKLKGAKLPKGLNVTKTDFKVRKIVIREQLKESEYVEGQRQINLKENITRLKHHSMNFRIEALRKLRESIISGHPGIKNHMNILVQGISAISLDIERDSRRESFKTLSSLLGSLTTEIVEPFFHIISSYLRCAMTHIQPNIKEDSLLMLDVILQHVPTLVATHSEKIFKNFLEMISSVRLEGDRANRTLTINMGQKQTTIRWRFKVLQRLQQMFLSLVEYKQRMSTFVKNNTVTKTFTFNVKEPQYYSLKRNYCGQVCDLSFIFCRSLGKSNISTVLENDDSVVIRSYAEHLMPLLLETWLEVRPAETTQSNVIISEDAALTLKIILQLIENLWTLIEIHELKNINHELSAWFRQEYSELFNTNFMLSSFPYQQNETKEIKSNTRPKKKQLAETDEHFCLEQNFNITHLMCLFYNGNVENQEQKFKISLNYLNSIVSNLDAYPQQNIGAIENTLRAHLLTNGNNLLHLNENELRKLLQSTINAFLNNKFPSNDGVSAKILVLLCDIVSSTQLFNAYGSLQFEPLLEYLPQHLLKTNITEAALNSMSILGKQKNVVFLNALEKLIIPVIKNIQQIKVSGSLNAFEGKKQIINLFYWTEKIDKLNQLNNLHKLIEENVTDKRIVGYFKYVLELNYNR